MRWDRREFMRAATIAVTGGVLRAVPVSGQRRPPAATVPVFTPLRRNVGTFTARGGTVGWLIAPNGVAVVDSQFPDTAQMFVHGLRQRTQRKIDVLVNTHHHADHTAGNRTLRRSAVKIVGHAGQPDLQRQQAVTAGTEADQVYADETFTDAWTIDLGNEVVSGKHYGPAHTGADVAVSFERANVVHMGDLMFHQRHAVIDRPGGASIHNWIAALDKVSSEHGADTLYIFGHSKAGAPVTGTRADLNAFSAYLSALLDFTRKQISAGKSVEEIANTPELPGFKEYAGILVRPLQMAYEELTSKS